MMKLKVTFPGEVTGPRGWECDLTVSRALARTGVILGAEFSLTRACFTSPSPFPSSIAPNTAKISLDSSSCNDNCGRGDGMGLDPDRVQLAGARTDLPFPIWNWFGRIHSVSATHGPT